MISVARASAVLNSGEPIRIPAPPGDWVLRTLPWMSMIAWDRMLKRLNGQYATSWLQSCGATQCCKGELYVSPEGALIIDAIEAGE
jgi:hypothetical protein